MHHPGLTSLGQLGAFIQVLYSQQWELLLDFESSLQNLGLDQ